MNERASSYTRCPDLPPELMPRMAAIIQVLSGLKTVSEAAREVGLSRNHFQTILHRSLVSMIETLKPKEPGRPARAPALSELERRMRQLERENSRLKKRVEATDELLTVAGSLLHASKTGARARRPRTRAQSPDSGDDPEEDPSGWHEEVLHATARMRELGVSLTRAAVLAGYDASTLRRWRCGSARRLASTHKLLTSRPTDDVVARATTAVRELHGLVGAASLSHDIAGLTRRAAARIKAATLTAMERERKGELEHILITRSGVVRGLDAMYFKTNKGPRFALLAADAAVPYRTHVEVSAHYDGALVATLIERDIEQHGAPLVLRADRARAHDTPEVKSILEKHRVLLLHGPPHCPRYYGQLERQNREHRAWLAVIPELTDEALTPLLERMIASLNTLWRRPTLDWRTAEEAWRVHPAISQDIRCAFHEEVHNRTRSITRSTGLRLSTHDLAERLAIEQTLEHMGYLHRKIGGWC